MMLETIKQKLGFGDRRQPPKCDPPELKHVGGPDGYGRFKFAGFDGQGYEAFLELDKWNRLDEQGGKLSAAISAIDGGPVPRTQRIEEMLADTTEGREWLRTCGAQYFAESSTVLFRLALTDEFVGQNILLAMLDEADVKAIAELYPDGKTEAQKAESIAPLQKELDEVNRQKAEIEKASRHWLTDTDFSHDWPWRKARVEEAETDWQMVQTRFCEPVTLRAKAISLVPAALRKTLSEAHQAAAIRMTTKDPEALSWGHPWERSKEGPDIIITPNEMR